MKADMLLDDTWEERRRDMMAEIIKLSKSKLVIVEGIQLLEYLDEIYGKNWKCNYCFIVAGTSRLLTSIRRFKQYPRYTMAHPLRFVRHYIFGNNKRTEKRIRKFRKECSICSDNSVEIFNDESINYK